MTYWLNFRTLQRVLVILITIPTVIFTNAMRVAFVGDLVRERAESGEADETTLVFFRYK
ncbi:hypothetical protein [Maridesulfovibrio sp.]|uniref:hypothetical protein n=1 Tax=Maridesulfovibrio sp. TaxID=2795000 RepID=UPI0029CA31FC|nr:hypothetical protein [Maridesulfovibrio sp.]